MTFGTRRRGSAATSVLPGAAIRRTQLVAGRPAITPGTRAVFGALLCTTAALLTFLAFARANRPPATSYVIATRDLAPGAILESGDVELVAIKLPSAVQTQAVEAVSLIEGATLLGPIAQGELIQRGQVIRRPVGERVVSFPMNSAYALGGRLRAGSRVSVYADEGNTMQPIADNVAVLRNDQGGTSGTSIITITVPASTDEARLVQAITNSKIVLVEGPRPGSSETLRLEKAELTVTPIVETVQ